MKKVALLIVAVFALLALGGTHATYAASGDSVTVTMNAQNGSGQDGTAVLTDMGDGTTKVVVNISNGSSTAQPAHIHEGSCANLNPTPKYPLTNVVNGTSETIVPASLADVADGTYAINVHKSAAEVSVYTSCGDIMAMQTSAGSTAGMPATGNGDFLMIAGIVALLGAFSVGAGLKLARTKA